MTGAKILFTLLLLVVCGAEVKELSRLQLLSALNHWQEDVAVMFFAPWCQYCKQFSPYWEEIANVLETRKNMKLTRFNCELVIEGHGDVCHEFGVENYPSVYFIGYGNFFQSNSFKQNVVKYNADIYPDAVLIWLQMLNTISLYQRKWDALVYLLPFATRKSRLVLQQSELIEQNKALNEKLKHNKNVEEMEKSRKMLDKEIGVDRGDVFPLLHSLDVKNQKNLPLRMCVADYALEYCRIEDTFEHEYCSTITKCAQDFMRPEACRPSSCPFNQKRGCTLLSNCLDINVIKLYKAANDAIAPV